MIKKYSRQPHYKSLSAISLIELMLSLAVISMLLVMSTRYFRTVQYQQKINHTATMVKDIISAAHSWGTSNPDMANINLEKLIKVNLLPTTYVKNPWGGAVSIGPKQDDAYSITITLSKLPNDACQTIKNQFSDYTIDCADT